MIQFAVNYSPQAAALLGAGTVEFDRFKGPEWPDLIAEARQWRPVRVHFSLFARRASLNTANWGLIETVLEETGTPFVNIHLAPHVEDFPGLALETHSADWVRRVADELTRVTQTLVDRFGPERVIAENVPWDPNPRYAIPRAALDPAVPRQVIAETGCGLLLDVAHARIAALHTGWDERDYIAALPVEHIREMHIAGTYYDDEQARWRDHLQMTEPDWALAEWAFGHIARGDWPAPDLVALEYGGIGQMFEWRSRSDVLAADVPRLGALIRASETRLNAPG